MVCVAENQQKTCLITTMKAGLVPAFITLERELMTYRIDERFRALMRLKVINGAKKYKQYLIDKDFMVVCEDRSIHIVRFFKKDFKHLTGLLSDLADGDFFTKCSDGELSIQNILEMQKYNISTLKFKTNKIENIDKIVYNDTNKNLLMVKLHTNTGDYPVAIRNEDISMCIGFRDSNNHARTLRKYTNSGNADEQLKIIAIFAKPSNSSHNIYTERVYFNSNYFCLFNDITDMEILLSEEVRHGIMLCN